MIKSVVLDISKHSSPAVQTIILRQGDKASVSLEIFIQEDGETFDLTDYEARFMALLPNGKVIIDPCVKSVANTLSYTLPAALSAQKGTINLAYIAIYKDDEWLASTDCMTFKIHPGIDISAEVAEDILGEYLQLKAQLDAILQLAEEQKENQQTEWESQMAAQDAEYQKAEAERSVNEAERQAAEISRAEAEESRLQAEMARVEAENTRATAEDIRISNENARIDAETARATAEENRETAEAERIVAENERIEAENARVVAETKREEEIAEVLRFIQEQIVITNEEIDDLWNKN